MVRAAGEITRNKRGKLSDREASGTLSLPTAEAQKLPSATRAALSAVPPSLLRTLSAGLSLKRHRSLPRLLPKLQRYFVVVRVFGGERPFSSVSST